jgi:hypothetical protein
MKEQVTIYCTKYALTRGIFQLTGHLLENGKYFSEDAGTGIGIFLNSKEFCFTEEEAVSQFEQKKAAKIASAREQLAKLEATQPVFNDSPGGVR